MFALAAVILVACFVTREPAAIRFVYDDLDRFSAAYARLPLVRDSAGDIDRAYLADPTIGLRLYKRMYGVTGNTMLSAIRHRPEYFESLTSLPDRVRAEEPATRRALARFKEIYKHAVFAPVFYLVGGGRAGGSGSPIGVLIAADIYGLSASSDLSEFSSGVGSYHRTEDLPHLVAHEMVHINQLAAAPLAHHFTTNLDRAVTEGAADFIAMLVSGDHINAEAHLYGSTHECALWRSFSQVLDGADTGDWFFIRPANGEWPQDLGYYLGYRIVETYYERANDQTAAMSASIGAADGRRLLTKSGYSGGC
jgi:hypothetical protein